MQAPCQWIRYCSKRYIGIDSGWSPYAAKEYSMTIKYATADDIPAISAVEAACFPPPQKRLQHQNS